MGEITDYANQLVRESSRAPQTAKEHFQGTVH
jgi:hypothetical protein